MAAIGFPLPRFCLSVLFAGITTLMIAYLMQALIKPEEVAVLTRTPSLPIEWVRLIKDEEPAPVKEQPEPPPVVEREPPRVVTPEHAGGGTELVVTHFKPPGFQHTGPNTGHADGDLLPIVAITPDYPERARSRSIEGYVVLEFTVNARGQVENARVIDAEPAAVFNHAALRAIERFRYRPRVVNGEALAVRGVKTRLRFNLGAG